MNWIKANPVAIVAISVVVIFAVVSIGNQSARPADFQDCIDSYAMKGGTNQIVIWGHQMCATAFDQGETDERRAWALCAINRIPDVRAENAFRIVSDQCYKSNVQ